MKILVYLTIVLLPMFLRSQTTYSFLLNNTKSTLSCNAVNNFEGGVDVIMSEFTGVDYGPKELIRGYILTFDQNGDTTSYNYFFNDTTFNFGNIIKLDNGYLITGNSKFPDVQTYNIFICRLNENKQIIWTKHYSNHLFNWPEFGDIFRIDNHFYLCGLVTMGNTSSLYPYLLKISADGIIVDELLYSEYGQGQYRYLLSQDSSQIWLFSKCCLEPFNAASVVKFDLNLNYISAEPLYEGYLERLYPKWHSNGTFLISSLQNRPDAQYQDDDIFINKFDTSFNSLQWNNFGSQDTSDVPAMMNSAIDFIDPDSIFLAGYKNKVVFGLPSPLVNTWIIAGQLDSLLQPRYINYIGGDGYYETSHMIATYDGGFFITAGKFNFETQLYNQFFIKLNSEGLLVNNQNNDLNVFKSNLWPNPVRNELNIDFFKKDSYFIIYNLLGKKLTEGHLQIGRTIVDVTFLYTGTYILRIVCDNKIIENRKFIKSS